MVPLLRLKGVDETRIVPQKLMSGQISASDLSRTLPPHVLNFGTFIQDSIIGMVVVDRHYDIRAINGSARADLQIHGVAIGEDLIHLVRDVEGDTLRRIIDAAFVGEPPETHDIQINDLTGNLKTKWLQISATSDRVEGNARSETVAVLIVDITEKMARRRDLEQIALQQEEKLEHAVTHIRELGLRQKSLIQANQDLTRANVELRNSHEQLLVNTEETASANEEIETLNEEMQATNEELETLNEELQATVEELNTTNDELEARGSDLARLADVREMTLARTKAERNAALTMLERSIGPFALVSQGEVTYASESIGGAAALEKAPKNWWEEPTLALGGATFEPSVLRVDDLTIVSLHKL